MKKIIDYTFAQAKTKEELVMLMKELLKDGWEPIGSPFETYDCGEVINVSQAIVMYLKEFNKAPKIANECIPVQIPTPTLREEIIKQSRKEMALELRKIIASSSTNDEKLKRIIYFLVMESNDEI